MIHTSPYFTPPKWAQLRSPYFSSFFTPFYPFVCVFSQSCILTPNACWVVDCLKYLEVCRHFIIPRELEDQPSRLRLVVWKTATQRRLSNVSLLLSHIIRHSCTLSECHIEISKCNVSGIYIQYFRKSFNLFKFTILRSAPHCYTWEMIYAATFLLAYKNIYFISLTQTGYSFVKKEKKISHFHFIKLHLASPLLLFLSP